MKKLLLIGASVLVAATAGAQKRQFAPPVMGWSSWNTLALNINEQNICANADAQASSGLRDAGYKYCNIDDGYMGGRDAQGNMTSNNELFPRGMRYVADYIRSKGLIPGIYNDAGGNTCGSPNFKTPAFGQNVGFHGHEAADCDLYFNKWGYDFVKVDYCGASGLGLQEEGVPGRVVPRRSRLMAYQRRHPGQLALVQVYHRQEPLPLGLLRRRPLQRYGHARDRQGYAAQ